MTNKNYYTSSNYAGSPIPTYKEFHRYVSNELSQGDFCTDYPSGYQINKVASAIRWTEKNSKKRNNNYK